MADRRQDRLARGAGARDRVPGGPAPPLAPRSLVWATELDVLPPDRVIERREDHWAVRSPGNPRHYWGNLLLFDAPPRRGERERWERLFEAEFADEPRVAHRTFAWDCPDDGAAGAAGEFVARGYEVHRFTGLVAAPEGVRPHPRENREVEVRELDPRPGAAEELWAQVLELGVAARPRGEDEAEAARSFHRRRLDDVRGMLAAGRGGWYVALEPGGGEVVATLGVVVTDGLGRYQTVVTAAPHRRRGIASRLVREAAGRAAARHGAARLVIVADPGSRAVALYESLGFRRVESVAGVRRRPP